MSVSNVYVKVRLVTDAFNEQMRLVTEAFRRFGQRAVDAARAMNRIRRGVRSGNRHRGTVAWRLRYAPASNLPLGQRTAAKRRALG